jgi:hypothetical protein
MFTKIQNYLVYIPLILNENQKFTILIELKIILSV